MTAQDATLSCPCHRAATSKRPRTAGGGRGVGSTLTPPKPVTYADLGGIEPILDDIRELIEYPLKHPEVRLCVCCEMLGWRAGVGCSLPLPGTATGLVSTAVFDAMALHS